MQLLDWIVIAVYFFVLFLIALYSVFQSKETSADYFLAGRSLGWFPVGASIFASNIGSEHLVGLAGSGVTDGIALAHYELHAWCLLILGWVLAPYYFRSGIFTMPQFLERRFSPLARYMLSIISLTAYIFTKIAVGIFAGGIVFSVLLPEFQLFSLDSFWTGSLLVLVVTGVYTIVGGFRVVAYTETVQTFILIIGSLLVTYYGLQAIGGWSELTNTVGEGAFQLWKPIVPDGVEGTWQPVESYNQDGVLVRQAWYFNTHYPWLGMLFCAPIIGLWYWCTDQYIVQRTLGARDIDHARRGAIFAAFLKLLPVFIFIVPGIICHALILKGQAGYNFQSMLYDGTSSVRESGLAFPLMVQNVLPVGIRGLVVAGLLSALMSSLAGVFNASATLFTMDIYLAFFPQSSEKRTVFMGRIATLVVVLIGIAWIPVIQGSRGLYDYLQSVQGYFAPPIFVVFFFGIFWKRLNAPGCIAALIIGFLLGLFRLAIDTPPKIYEQFSYQDGSFFWIVNKIYFQYFSLLIFVASLITFVVVSYLTRQPDYQQIRDVTYGAGLDEIGNPRDRRVDKLFSIFILLMILAIYLYFS